MNRLEDAKMPNLNLSLNDRAAKILDGLSKKTGKSKAELVRNAIILLNLVDKESEKRRTLALVDEDTDRVVSKILNVL